MKKELKIIALNGQMGSGKDSIGSYLIQEHGYKKVSIADPIYLFAFYFYNVLRDKDKNKNKKAIKDILSIMFEDKKAEILEDIYSNILETAQKTNLGEEGYEKPRLFLQDTGMLLREYKKDVYIDFLIKQIKELSQQNNNLFIITDLRLQEEIEMLKDKLLKVQHLYFIKIKVSLENTLERLKQRDNVSESYIISKINHTTEKEISDDFFDFIIDGNNSFTEVLTDIDIILHKINLD